jgi:CRP-like cAMP-binding protein
MGHGPELFGKICEQGKTVFHQGEPGTEIVVIQSGALETSSPNRGRRTLLEKDDFFGEMALIDIHPRSAAATAITRTRLPALSRDIFLQKISDKPDAGLKGLKPLCSRIVHMIRRVHAMIDGAAALRKKRLASPQPPTEGMEATRGLLIHKYRINGGTVEKPRRLVATQFNNARINLLIINLARRYSRNGRLAETGNRRILRCVRRFDSCLSCATH